MVLLWPAGTDEEPAPATTVYPAPEIVASEMSTVAVPVFVTITLCVVLVPTATFPKLRLEELGVSTPAVELFEPSFDAAALGYAAQPDSPATKPNVIITKMVSGTQSPQNPTRLGDGERRTRADRAYFSTASTV